MAGDARVQVSIYGNDYRVRGEADPEYIRGLAAYVDRTMKEIAAGSRQVSPLRIAILAAFNIADELHRERAGRTISPAAEEKAARLLRLFDDDAVAAGGGD
ncbi:cell division protein ZapA [bacterium]|nr:cell division protein ZapA [bacterium]